MRRTAAWLPLAWWGLAALISTGSGTAVSAQTAGPSLEDHAGVVRNALRDLADRKAHAEAFVKAAGPDDWPLAFDVLRDVANRRDRLEAELAEASRPISDRGGLEVLGRAVLRGDRAREESERKARVREAERGLRADEAVLEVFRSGLTPTAATSDPASFGDFIARRTREREPLALAWSVRALGFFPTPSARRIVVDHLDDSNDVVALAAVRACEDHALALESAGTDDPLWPEALARLQTGLTQAWRDRDAQHRRYRVLAGKSTALFGKSLAELLKLIEATANLLKDIFSGERIPRLRIPDSLPLDRAREIRREYEQALKQQEEASRELRKHDRRISAILRTAGRVFDRLSAEQRGPVEATLAKRLQNANHQPNGLRLIELCGHLRSEPIGHALVVATSAWAAEARVAACMALGRHRRKEHVLPLAARFGDSHWQVEVAAIHALRSIEGREAVDMLVTGVALKEGRVREEANRALSELTGEDCQGDPLRWKAWWEQNRDRCQGAPGPSKASNRAEEKPPPDGGIDCFGIRTRSRRILFILDTSAPMGTAMNRNDLLLVDLGPKPAPGTRKIDHALDALGEAIAALPQDAAFNVVLYGDKVNAWKREPVRAHARNKEAARKWAARTDPSGGAAVFDALVRAFDPAGRETNARLRSTAADTFFLVAGSPSTGGGLTLDVEIVEEIERINRLEHVVIHTVAVGASAPVPFLRMLADRCGGQFGRLTDGADEK